MQAVISAIKIIINVIDSGLLAFGSVRNVDVVKHSIMVNIIYKYGS
jgi:hypothetical protein